MQNLSFMIVLSTWSSVSNKHPANCAAGMPSRPCPPSSVLECLSVSTGPSTVNARSATSSPTSSERRSAAANPHDQQNSRVCCD